jgi:hypothetical protein
VLLHRPSRPCSMKAKLFSNTSTSTCRRCPCS